jgi:cell division initiation protein
MRISPNDIRQQQFTVRVFRGFDPQEVDAFLEDVADDYEALLKESQLLREQVAAQEERSRGVMDLERTLQDTLVTTQRLADDL